MEMELVISKSLVCVQNSMYQKAELRESSQLLKTQHIHKEMIYIGT